MKRNMKLYCLLGIFTLTALGTPSCKKDDSVRPKDEKSVWDKLTPKLKKKKKDASNTVGGTRGRGE